MPLLPLPPGDSALIGGDVPVRSEADVLAEFPSSHRRPTTAPVRDAFAEAWAEGFKAYQNVAAYAAAQSDPLYATGEYLRSFAEERSVIPSPDEDDESIRARLFQAPKIVTPDALCERVNAILAPYTDKKCTLSELELDGLFVHDGTAEWDSFIGADPEYPDRYYEDLPHRLPGGAIPSQGLVRSFLLRVPSLEENDRTISYALDLDEDGIFVADGSGDGEVGLYAFVNPELADNLYAMIVGLIETIKGQGMSWSLLVDPNL